MPELPEVETCRRVLRRVLQGHKIVDVDAVPDTIVFGNHPPEEIRQALLGRVVNEIGRHGKFWWIEFDSHPWLYGHLGMSGWIRELGEPTARLREHGKKPLDDDNGRPRFLKLLLTSETGARVCLTDGRRLARVWLGNDPGNQKPIQGLGPDVFENPRSSDEVHAILKKRTAPIKALLLDQKLFAGIGNYLADEVLFQSGIAPSRLGKDTSKDEVELLLSKITSVIRTAIEVGADSDKFPEDWLFHTRWGGAKGVEQYQGEPVLRETIGGRTTAWVPTRQK